MGKKKEAEIVGFDNGPNTLKRLTTWQRNNQPDAQWRRAFTTIRIQYTFINEYGFLMTNVLLKNIFALLE